jgi:hypothetical protein
MSKSETSPAAIALGISVAIPLVIISILLYSYTLTKLWHWFLVPVLGLPPIGMAQAYGIMLIVAMMARPANLKDNDDETSISRTVKYLYVRPLLTLLFGWVAAQFFVS